MRGRDGSRHRSSDWFEVVSTFWLLLTQVSQANQHPVLCFPQGKPGLLIGCHLYLSVCVCDDDGWQGQDRACQQTSAISFGSGLFHIAQTPIHLTKHPTEPTWSPEGATVSRSRALWCLHRGIIHLHWLDRGNTCSETDAQRVYLSFRFQFHVSFLQEGWKGGPSWGYIKREPLFWLLSEMNSTNTSQKKSECWPRNILIHLFITWFRLYSEFLAEPRYHSRAFKTANATIHKLISWTVMLPLSQSLVYQLQSASISTDTVYL